MKKNITGIYLAAGKSSRFGGNKLFARVGKNALGSMALMTSLESRLDQIAVITKETDTLDWIPPHLQQLHKKKWHHIPCAASVHGQANSLHCGLRFAENSNADAVIIMLADQPLISKEMINALIIRYEAMMANQEPVSFIASTKDGIPCPPILFPQNMFSELDQLRGDAGARFLIRNKMEKGNFIPFIDQDLFFDVDTETDYRKLLKQVNQP